MRKTTKISGKIAGLRVEIRTLDLSNMNEERYPLDRALGHYIDSVNYFNS
jgi:hypothetical protein